MGLGKHTLLAGLRTTNPKWLYVLADELLRVENANHNSWFLSESSPWTKPMDKLTWLSNKLTSLDV